MRIFAKFFMAAAMVFALTAQAARADIKVGVAAEPYPPFTEKGSDGIWHGWEIDVMHALCKAMNEKCKIVEVSWDGIIPALLSKKIDVIMSSMSITPEREKTISFSDKYYNTPAVIVAPKASKIDGSPASVKGKVVGVQVSTTHQNYVQKHYKDATIKTYSTFDEQNQDLVAGRIDAAVGDSLAFTPFLDSAPGQCCAVKADLHDLDVFGPGVGAGIRKNDTALKDKINAAIKTIRSDGTYDAISKKYFNFDIFGG